MLSILIIFESWTLSDFKKDSLCSSTASSLLSILRVQESNTSSILKWFTTFNSKPFLL